MAYPDHYLLQYGGSLFGVEEWSNSLRLVPNAGGVTETEASTTMALDDLEADLRAFYATARFSQALTVDYIKLNRIGPDGKYLSKTHTNVRYPSVQIKGTATSYAAPQLSVVCTLLTAAQRGYASRGRVFLAGMSGLAQDVQLADGAMNDAQRVGWRDAFAGFLNNINNWPGLDAAWAGLDVSVVSDGGLSLVGAQNKVTGVQVGRVLDTQRRRRASLNEDRGVAAPVS